MGARNPAYAADWAQSATRAGETPTGRRPSSIIGPDGERLAFGLRWRAVRSGFAERARHRVRQVAEFGRRVPASITVGDRYAELDPTFDRNLSSSDLDGSLLVAIAESVASGLPGATRPGSGSADGQGDVTLRLWLFASELPPASVSACLEHAPEHDPTGSSALEPTREPTIGPEPVPEPFAEDPQAATAAANRANRANRANPTNRPHWIGLAEIGVADGQAIVRPRAGPELVLEDREDALAAIENIVAVTPVAGIVVTETTFADNLVSEAADRLVRNGGTGERCEDLAELDHSGECSAESLKREVTERLGQMDRPELLTTAGEAPTGRGRRLQVLTMLSVKRAEKSWADQAVMLTRVARGGSWLRDFAARDYGRAFFGRVSEAAHKAPRNLGIALVGGLAAAAATGFFVAAGPPSAETRSELAARSGQAFPVVAHGAFAEACAEALGAWWPRPVGWERDTRGCAIAGGNQGAPFNALGNGLRDRAPFAATRGKAAQLVSTAHRLNGPGKGSARLVAWQEIAVEPGASPVLAEKAARKALAGWPHGVERDGQRISLWRSIELPIADLGLGGDWPLAGTGWNETQTPDLVAATFSSVSGAEVDGNGSGFRVTANSSGRSLLERAGRVSGMEPVRFRVTRDGRAVLELRPLRPAVTAQVDRVAAEQARLAVDDRGSGRTGITSDGDVAVSRDLSGVGEVAANQNPNPIANQSTGATSGAVGNIPPQASLRESPA